MERYQDFGDKNQLFLGSDEIEVKVSVVYNKLSVMFRHFHKVGIVSVSPGKEVKAGNGFAQIGLHELQAAGLSQSASSTCFDLSSSLGKVASQTCLLQLNLSPVSMSHGSPSFFGGMTAGSC